MSAREEKWNEGAGRLAGSDHLDHIGYHPPYSAHDLLGHCLRLLFQLDGDDVWIEGELDATFLGAGPHAFIASDFSPNLRP